MGIFLLLFASSLRGSFFKIIYTLKREERELFVCLILVAVYIYGGPLIFL